MKTTTPPGSGSPDTAQRELLCSLMPVDPPQALERLRRMQAACDHAQRLLQDRHAYRNTRACSQAVLAALAVLERLDGHGPDDIGSAAGPSAQHTAPHGHTVGSATRR